MNNSIEEFEQQTSGFEHTHANSTRLGLIEKKSFVINYVYTKKRKESNKMIFI